MPITRKARFLWGMGVFLFFIFLVPLPRAAHKRVFDEEISDDHILRAWISDAGDNLFLELDGGTFRFSLSNVKLKEAIALADENNRVFGVGGTEGLCRLYVDKQQKASFGLHAGISSGVLQEDSNGIRDVALPKTEMETLQTFGFKPVEGFGSSEVNEAVWEANLHGRQLDPKEYTDRSRGTDFAALSGNSCDVSRALSEDVVRRNYFIAMLFSPVVWLREGAIKLLLVFVWS